VIFDGRQGKILSELYIKNFLMEKQKLDRYSNIDRYSKISYHIVHFYTMYINSAYINKNTCTNNIILLICY